MHLGPLDHSTKNHITSMISHGYYIIILFYLCCVMAKWTRPTHGINDRVVCIGVIYGGTRGTGTPTFWTEGYSTLYPSLFKDKKVNNLLSPADNRSDLRRINYNKTIFGLSWESSRRSDPKVGWGGGISSPFSSPFALGPKGASFSFWIGSPNFLDQS